MALRLSPSRYPLPFYSCQVSAGFPSPADDHLQDTLDLNELLVPHPAATFLVRAAGDSMVGAGIFPRDILIVDRALEPRNGQVVIAVVNGELLVKRLELRSQCVRLLAENPQYAPLAIDESMGFEIWGVVTNVIHNL